VSDAPIPGALLAVLDQARSQGFLGPMELEGQVEHALGFAQAFGQAQALRHAADGPGGTDGPGRWLDLGSGGGLPGLVLAQCWPRTTAVLLDSSERRTAFLSEAVRTLGWDDRVRVVRARAEGAGSNPDLRASFDVVWARSFGSPPVTAECAAPFLRTGGLLVVSEPPSPGQDGVRWPRDGLAELGQEPLTTIRDTFGYQVVLQATPCPERFPRRSGVASKRPLYRVGEG
jgi:16S rRNA (guanine527-N7)-methyltransferase